MQVWKCDRCNKTYEKNSNTLLKTLNNPIVCGYEDYGAAHIKFSNYTFSIESSWKDLCDECFLELEKWLLNK
jgi:hypothetical protein